jgi:hypothetical protein
MTPMAGLNLDGTGALFAKPFAASTMGAASVYRGKNRLPAMSVLAALVCRIDAATDVIGRAAAWLTPLVVGALFLQTPLREFAHFSRRPRDWPAADHRTTAGPAAFAVAGPAAPLTGASGSL